MYQRMIAWIDECHSCPLPYLWTYTREGDVAFSGYCNLHSYNVYLLIRHQQAMWYVKKKNVVFIKIKLFFFIKIKDLFLFTRGGGAENYTFWHVNCKSMVTGLCAAPSVHVDWCVSEVNAVDQRTVEKALTVRPFKAAHYQTKPCVFFTPSARIGLFFWKKMFISRDKKDLSSYNFLHVFLSSSLTFF